MAILAQKKISKQIFAAISDFWSKILSSHICSASKLLSFSFSQFYRLKAIHEVGNEKKL
jgi:hypothetical protein